MVYISEDVFIYNGISSSDYGLRFMWVNKTPDTAMTSSKSYTYQKNRANNSFLVSKSSYDEPLRFDAEMISDRVLSDLEVREIYLNFFNGNKFKELRILNELYADVVLNCMMTNPERIEGGIGNGYGVIGFSVEIVCDAPWGWSEEIAISPAINYSNGNSATFNIYCYTDLQEYIYPEVSLTTKALGSCSASTRLGDGSGCAACEYKDLCQTDGGIPKALIINNTDSSTRGLCIIASENESAIEVKPKTGLFMAENTSVASRTNKKFLRLLPGKNEIYVENVKDLTIKFREARILV